MPTVVWCLRWTDVDPATHAFDARSVAALVASHLAAPFSPDDAQAVEDRIDRALIGELGHWAAGWRWASSEPGGGGPVAAYCCAPHSLRGTPEAKREVVVGALKAWRQRLEELSERFAAQREAANDMEIGMAASCAATSLLPLVVEWTKANDAWYATYQRILAWYLESLLGESDRIYALVSEAIGGRFKSWSEPDAARAEAVCGDVGVVVAREAAEGPPFVDHLHQWIGQREKIRWRTDRGHAPEPVRRDGHERYIETVDARRDPERADRMRDALKATRQAAAAEIPLTFDLLAQWQAIVMGAPLGFREGVAHAHGGAERYGLEGRTQRRFEQCLEHAMDPAFPSVVRAARVYLDVCFFHPFPDGNARAARLALDYVLTRDGLALHAAEPIFLVARRVPDSYGVYSFQYVIDYLAGARISPAAQAGCAG